MKYRPGSVTAYAAKASAALTVAQNTNSDQIRLLALVRASKNAAKASEIQHQIIIRKAKGME